MSHLIPDAMKLTSHPIPSQVTLVPGMIVQQIGTHQIAIITALNHGFYDGTFDAIVLHCGMTDIQPGSLITDAESINYEPYVGSITLTQG